MIHVCTFLANILHLNDAASMCLLHVIPYLTINQSNSNYPTGHDRGFKTADVNRCKNLKGFEVLTAKDTHWQGMIITYPQEDHSTKHYILMCSHLQSGIWCALSVSAGKHLSPIKKLEEFFKENKNVNKNKLSHSMLIFFVCLAFN